jgi:hypothetical protein
MPESEPSPKPVRDLMAALEDSLAEVRAKLDQDTIDRLDELKLLAEIKRNSELQESIRLSLGPAFRRRRRSDWLKDG